MHAAGVPTPLDHVKRIVVLVVNSLSSPPTAWDTSEVGPGMADVLLKATGVPIDHHSYEAVELLKDISARWETARHLRDLAGCSTAKDSAVCAAIRVPQAKIYAIDDLRKGWCEGFARHSKDQLHALRGRIAALNGRMADVKSRERLTFTRKPGGGRQGRDADPPMLTRRL